MQHFPLVLGNETRRNDRKKRQSESSDPTRYDAFGHLCSALCLGENAVVAVLTAYFDEAGTDSLKPAVAVGCYVATKEQWDCFQHDWRWLREWSGVQGYFRRADQETYWLREDTEHWDRAKQITVFQAQHAFIHAHTLKGYAGTVIKDDYDAAIQGVDRRALGTPYEFCLRHCLAGIANFLVDRPDDRITYIIESGAEGEGHLKRAFELFLNDAELKKMFRLENVRTWGFVSKDEAMPLQAADALAYEVAKEMENRFGRIKRIKRKPRKSFVDLVRPQIDDLGSSAQRRIVQDAGHCLGRYTEGIRPTPYRATLDFGIFLTHERLS